MATPEEIMDMAASLLNDTAQTVYTDTALLPYINMALDALQEEFETQNIPVTNEVSAILNVPLNANQTHIGFAGTIPILPGDLLEIQRLWESQEGQNQWVPMVRKDFIPHYIEGVQTNMLLIWAWINQEIVVPASNADVDIKLDYIAKRIPTPLNIAQITTNIPIINIKSYAGYLTAAYAAQFILENPERAQALMGLAEAALNRVVVMNNKGRQAIMTRRRPFRAAYKVRGRPW